MCKKRNVRAQATTFIIIGIIILILIVSSVYITKIVKKEGFIGEKIAGDPITVYVEQCTETITEEALMMAGKQGGYIYLDLYQEDKAKLTPFDSEMLIASPYASLPYWFYQKTKGLDRSEMPKLDKASDFDYSIQDQIERYIVQELPSCLNNFKPFTDQGYRILTQEEPKADVIFTTEDTVVTVTYPLTVTNVKNDTKIIDKFSAQVDIRMREVYDLAKDITQYEAQTAFIEQNTMNLITVYSGNDDKLLPPTFGGMEVVDCGNMVYWMEDDVYSNFKDMLALNSPYIKISNTDFERLIVTDQKDDKQRDTVQGLYDMMAKRVSERDYPHITALFEYRPGFPLELDLGMKGMIKPPLSMDFNYLIGKKCVYMYKFAYSYRYPLLTTLIDKKSKVRDQPYVFQFPLMIVTKNNFPRVKVADVLGLEEDEQLNYCGEKQKTSAESIVTIIDRETNEKIDDVMVYYQCGPAFVTDYDENGTLIESTPFAERCFIGKTGLVDKGTMISKFQPCIGGATVTAVKKGYDDAAVIVGDVYSGSSFNTIVQMTKMKDMKVDVKKYFVKKPLEEDELQLKPGVVLDENKQVVACNMYTPRTALEKNEEVIITMRRMDPSIILSNPDTIIVYNTEEEQTAELAPGTYQVDILLMRHEKWEGEATFKKDSQSFTIPGALFTSSKTITYPDEDVNAQTAFTGGAQFVFTITNADLKKDVIEFKIIDEGKPTRIEQVGNPVAHREACTKINYDKMKPTYGVINANGEEK